MAVPLISLSQERRPCSQWPSFGCQGGSGPAPRGAVAAAFPILKVREFGCTLRCRVPPSYPSDVPRRCLLFLALPGAPGRGAGVAAPGHGRACAARGREEPLHHLLQGALPAHPRRPSRPPPTACATARYTSHAAGAPPALPLGCGGWPGRRGAEEARLPGVAELLRGAFKRAPWVLNMHLV